MENNNTENKIGYEHILPYALLYFNEMDLVDVALILDEFRESNLAEISDSWFFFERYNNLAKNDYFFRIENGKLILNEKISKNPEGSLQRFIKSYSGDIVKRFFDSFDIDKFREKKENLLEEKKKELLEQGRVLLISDNINDYENLKEYGFLNIDYFQSIIRADNYFRKYPERLKTYCLAFKGHLETSYFPSFRCLGITEKLYYLGDTQALLMGFFDRYSIGNLVYYDMKNLREFQIKLFKDDFFDCVVGNFLINNWPIEKEKDKEFEPIQDFINPERIPLPMKMDDLKIRLYDYDIVNLDRLGGDITLNTPYKDLSSYIPFIKSIRDKLGCFDIIIKPEKTDDNLLLLNKECTEQCKDTGRDLVLLVSYSKSAIFNDEHILSPDYKQIGNKIKLYFTFAGRLADETKIREKSFNVLGNDTDGSVVEAVVGEAISLYSNVLKQNGLAGIEDSNIKSAEENDEDFMAYQTAVLERKEKEMEPIVAFDMFRDTIIKYLEFKKLGLIDESLENLIITEDMDTVTIESIFEGRRRLGSITFGKCYLLDGLKPFKIQRPTKRGLALPEKVAFYTSAFEGDSDCPNKPNEYQMEFINAFYKSVNFTITPLVNKVIEEKIETLEPKVFVKNIPIRKSSN